MFEFKKLCEQLETLSSLDRGIMLAEKSAHVIGGLSELDIPLNPLGTLVTFIIGSVVSDGSINEKNYLYIYPSLVKAFGADFDFISAKQAIGLAKDIKKEITKCTKDMLSIIAACDEDLAADVISLCLLITSVDGKISLKEKRYIRQLCKA